MTDDPPPRPRRCSSLSSAFLALVALMELTACGQKEGSGLERVRRAGVLRWGGDLQGGEPYVFEDPTHPGQHRRLRGRARATRSRASWACAPSSCRTTGPSLVPSLERGGSFDVALNGLEVTPVARRPRALHASVLSSSQRGSWRAGRRPSITSAWTSLRGLRVGTLANSLACELLRAPAPRSSPTRASRSRTSISSTAASTPCCSTTSSPSATALTRPALRVVDDVRRRLLRDRRAPAASATCATRSTRRSAASRRAGELRRILERWNIDSAARRRGSRAGPTPRPASCCRRSRQRRTSRASTRRSSCRARASRCSSRSGAMVLAVPARPAARARAHVRARRLCARSPPPTSSCSAARRCCCSSTSSTSGSADDPRGSIACTAPPCSGLGLNYAAYEAEIYRAGIQAVPKGQMEAALALGMPTPLALRRIIMPQAFRVALAGRDERLHRAAQGQLARVGDHRGRADEAHDDHRGRRAAAGWCPALLCAALYLAMSYPLSRLARTLEAKLSALHDRASRR